MASEDIKVKVRCNKHTDCDDSFCTHHDPHYADAEDPTVAYMPDSNAPWEPCTNKGECYIYSEQVQCCEVKAA